MPKKILLADDSITIQKVITITFATEDYDIAIAGDGNSAVKKAKELKPDLILADVAMPGKSGYEVCEAIKSDPVLKHIPVMLLAGTFEPLNKAEAERVKADDSIVKPFESQELIEKVAVLLLKNASAPIEEIAEIPAVELEPAELSVEPIEAFSAPPPPKAPLRPVVPPPPSSPIKPAAPPTPPKAEEPEIGGIDEMFGPSGTFFGGEEELASPTAESTDELLIGEQGGGFLDEEQESFVTEKKAVKPEPAKVKSEPEPTVAPPWRAAPTSPPIPPKVDIVEPQFEPMTVEPKAEPPKRKVEPEPTVVPPWRAEPPQQPNAPPVPPKIDTVEPQFESMTFEPPKEDSFEVPAFDFSKKADMPAEEPFWSESVSSGAVAPEMPAPEPLRAEKPSAAPEIKRAPEPVKEAPSFVAMRADKDKAVVSKVVESAVKEAEARVKEEAGERLKGVGISKDNLEESIAKIAREVIEEIAWEVVPELAEELIAAEFQRFKEAWAKSK